MNKRKWLNFSYVLLALSLASPAAAFAQQKDKIKKPLPLEAIEKFDAVFKALEALKQMELSMKALSREKRFNCIKAFGHSKFCDCLVENSAVGLSFEGYISVIILGKEKLRDLGYDSLNKEEKAIVDSAYKVRGLCVSKMVPN